MKFVSPVLKRVLYPALHSATLLRRWPRAGQLAVVTYHGVLPSGYRVTDRLLDGGWVTRETFRNQLRLLRSQYNVVAPDQVRRWTRNEEELPMRAVLLTCDDGLANTVAEMLPILKEENLPCLFFVTSESLSEECAMLWYEELYLTLVALPSGELKGNFQNVPVSASLTDRGEQRHRLWWELVSDLSSGELSARLGFARAIREHYGMPEDWKRTYLAGLGSRFRLLAQPEIRQLHDAGMSIGSHTISHPKLSKMSPNDALMEISRSRTDLEANLGVPVWSLAYPFGGTDSVSLRELQMAERAGYDCAFINFGGGFGPRTSRFGIPRLHVTLEMNLAEFEGHLCGLHESLRRHVGHVEELPSGPNGTRGGRDA